MCRKATNWVTFRGFICRVAPKEWHSKCYICERINPSPIALTLI